MYLVRPIYVHIAEMNDLEGGLACRREYCGVGRCRFRDRDGESVHVRFLTKSNYGVAELRRRLTERRDAPQIVGYNRALFC
jgi:hypothetical protein